MSIFALFFPKPTKQDTLEKLAKYRAEYTHLVAHEKLHKYINNDLLHNITHTAGKVAFYEARLKGFDSK